MHSKAFAGGRQRGNDEAANRGLTSKAPRTLLSIAMTVQSGTSSNLEQLAFARRNKTRLQHAASRLEAASATAKSAASAGQNVKHIAVLTQSLAEKYQVLAEKYQALAQQL